MNECATLGCAGKATHKRAFTIVPDVAPDALSCESWFCCQCVDMIGSEEGPPFLDLVVVGTVRAG